MNNKLRKQEKTHLKITLVILTLSFIVAFIAIIVSRFFEPMPDKVFYSLLPGLLVFYFMLFFYSKVAYKKFSYYMDERGLFINKGVFWQKKIVVPINRVQHTDITQGPLARRYDLAELTVHTAGTQSASVKIQGILHKHASELRSQLCFDGAEDSV